MQEFPLIFDPKKKSLLPDHSTCFACKAKILRKPNIFLRDGRAFHAKCVKCQRCQKVVSGPEGFLEIDGELLCLCCNYLIEREPCWRCRKPVMELKVVFNTHQYHPECLRCFRCQTNFLANLQYMLKDNNPYCKACYLEFFLRKCATCHEKLLPGVMYVELENVRYHTQCFNCTRCKENLMLEGYFRGTENLYYCLKCGEELNLDKKKEEEEKAKKEKEEKEKEEDDDDLESMTSLYDDDNNNNFYNDRVGLTDKETPKLNGERRRSSASLKQKNRFGGEVNDNRKTQPKDRSTCVKPTRHEKKNEKQKTVKQNSNRNIKGDKTGTSSGFLKSEKKDKNPDECEKQSRKQSRIKHNSGKKTVGNKTRKETVLPTRAIINVIHRS